MSYDYETYLSPFTWRYGSSSMRQLWSENNKRRLMRRVWVALATAQYEAGLITREQLEDLEEHQQDVNIARAQEIEELVRHDVMAEIRVYAEQCPVGGGIIHWGATSADITDNVDALMVRNALVLLIALIEELLLAFAVRIEQTADLPVMAYTHIQPAEPTTLGYRLSVYAQDLAEDLTSLRALEETVRGKGFKGAVGTQATFVEMLEGSGVSAAELEAEAMSILDLPYYPIATQIYSRKQDLDVLSALAGVAASLNKFALDFRLMQSPAVGEWAEPFGRDQTGSSAMPFKRNPIIAENICSLARYIGKLPAVAWDNASQSILERSLDDSANRRVIFPEAFLATEEIVVKAQRLITGMVLDRRAMTRNLQKYGPFAAIERLLTFLVAKGADRQQAYEWLREASLSAWEAVKNGDENPLQYHLSSDERIGRYLSADQISGLLAAGSYTGTAAERAVSFAENIRLQVGTPETKTI